MVERTYSIIMFGTPPSLNKLGARGSARLWHRKKRQLQAEIETLLLAEAMPGRSFNPTRLPRTERIEVTGRLVFTTNRGRDEGNYRSILEKAAGDALVNGGWLPDDTPERYSFGALQLLHRPHVQPSTTLFFTTTTKE